MNRFKYLIRFFLIIILGGGILNFLIMRMSPSGFLFVSIVLVIICGVIYFLLRGLFIISQKLGYKKNSHKKIIVVGATFLFFAFTWIPWWQYIFLSSESLSQKDKLNTAPIYWRFFFTDRSQDDDFLWRILIRRFEKERKVQELVSYLKKSGFVCREYGRTLKNTSADTLCENRHMAIVFENVWHVNIAHEEGLVTKIYVSQYLDAI